MATTNRTSSHKETTMTTDQLDGIAATMRRCVGSDRYGIVAHDALVADFPLQPSAKDGIGRMCKPHWREYTSGLRRDDLARKAGTAPAIDPTATYTQNVEAAERRRAKAGKDPKPVAVAEAKAPKPAKVAKPKAPRKAAVPRTGQESPAIEEARAIVAATEKLGGKAYTDAVASDEVQHALQVLAGTSDGPAIHEALRERFDVESVNAHDVGDETPLGETIDGGTEEADAAASDAA